MPTFQMNEIFELLKRSILKYLRFIYFYIDNKTPLCLFPFIPPLILQFF